MADNVLTRIMAVFTAIMNWIVDSVESITPMFYVDETGLTFLGFLAVAGLGFSVSFLNFLGFLFVRTSCNLSNCWKLSLRQSAAKRSF